MNEKGPSRVPWYHMGSGQISGPQNAHNVASNIENDVFSKDTCV